ncbi:hypothetical protein [Shewanella aestuarii]|uniref:Uncharacterized protein n=1 Tax=Shewanella aestuarii TaxID=1028752 RepID=A0A6G9QHR0_9GAMM|nr:hypothetical protein [Shewanella aestuarii]QIR13938.1 hypothetical protein HBH39_05015 [Shewanella aestuarii]
MNELSFQQQAALTAKLFRLGNEPEASQQLIQCLNILEQNHKNILSSVQMQQTIGLALQAQENQDWLGLADYLEYEMVALIHS